MSQEIRAQGELFGEFTAGKQKRARRHRRRRTVKPPKVIGQYMPDIPPAKGAMNL
jgi:hypothetical protein